MISNRLISSAIKRPCTLVSRFTSTSKDNNSIQPPNPRRISSDMVGPPDPVTNLRRVIFKTPSDETALEKKYREMRAEVQDWNHTFWTQHNSRFYQEREEYVQKHLPADKTNLTADEMSVFYKSFLDKNWKLHMQYNFEWYKKNYSLLALAFKVKLMKIFKYKH